MIAKVTTRMMYLHAMLVALNDRFDSSEIRLMDLLNFSSLFQGDKYDLKYDNYEKGYLINDGFTDDVVMLIEAFDFKIHMSPGIRGNLIVNNVPREFELSDPKTQADIQFVADIIESPNYKLSNELDALKKINLLYILHGRTTEYRRHAEFTLKFHCGYSKEEAYSTIDLLDIIKGVAM